MKWCVLNSVLIFVLYSIRNPYRERNIPVRLRSRFGVTFPTIDFTTYNCSYVRSHSCRTSLNVYQLQHTTYTIVSNTNYPAPQCANQGCLVPRITCISKLPFSAPDSQDTPRDSRTHRTHRTHRPPVHQTPQALQSATEPTGPTDPQCTRHPRHYRVLQMPQMSQGTQINRGAVVSTIY
jgi:hypothetical protein